MQKEKLQGQAVRQIFSLLILILSEEKWINWESLISEKKVTGININLRYEVSCT
ncbi:hypothetical protein PITCH_A2060001 [uncultured Desulfobacterium sp.]|uniref:Uncharacterized protein n=1 Tax=uncultured Desulfobacterium sp. TaxID=201089 RepID=A0A445MXC4_9BACT|nr:hypothetical protein PITCH_A2060001 [uncultured Desulfobacterium sp.]